MRQFRLPLSLFRVSLIYFLLGSSSLGQESGYALEFELSIEPSRAFIPDPAFRGWSIGMGTGIRFAGPFVFGVSARTGEAEREVGPPELPLTVGGTYSTLAVGGRYDIPFDSLWVGSLSVSLRMSTFIDDHRVILNGRGGEAGFRVVRLLTRHLQAGGECCYFREWFKVRDMPVTGFSGGQLAVRLLLVFCPS